MKRLFLVVLFASLGCAAPLPARDFADWFTGRALRLDYFHTGHAGLEVFALDRVLVEGVWPGPRVDVADATEFGTYRVTVLDPASGATLYADGFCSIFAEWCTTTPAQDGVVRTFTEAVRVPEPRGPVEVSIHRRDAANVFREVWRVPIDPADRDVVRGRAVPWTAEPVFANGDSAERVDVVFLGDGYVAAEAAKFRADVERLAGQLFQEEPFRSRRDEFNVWRVFSPSIDSGITNPRAARFRNTALRTRYDALGSERYVLTEDDRAWRDVAAAAPYEYTIILVNAAKYGGGGIFGLYSTAAADSAFAGYLVVHEFGHHFAGLGDEYFTSPVAYEEYVAPHVEPWEPNVTALQDPAALKWADLTTSDVALPTPWPHGEYETASKAFQARRARMRAENAPEAELEALFREEQQELGLLLQEHQGTVGAFEGALYQSRGLYRPAADCIMFTRDPVGFCAVCRRAIERRIDRR